MAVLTIAHPEHTKDLALATTAGRIQIANDVAHQIQALYLYCSAEVRYARSASPVADGGTAPTSDYGIIPAQTLVPIGLFPRASDVVINVWVTSGTPTLHVMPYPVTAS